MSSRTARPVRTFAFAAVLALAAFLLMTPAQTRTYATPLQLAVAEAAPTVNTRALGTKSTKLPAPNFDTCYGDVGYARLAWNLDYNDSGDNPISTDEKLIDHFNVYCDERLVAKVDINAVEETVWFNDGSRHHTWSLDYELPDKWVLHSFQIASVAKDGTEGRRSDALSAYAESYDVVIVSHNANVCFDYSPDVQAKVPHMDVDFTILSYRTVETLDIWRSEGTTAPDTSAKPYTSIPKRPAHVSGWDFSDANVVANKTYTYTVQATDSEGTASNYYTFSIKYLSKDNPVTFSTPDVTYELANGSTPTLSFTAYNWKSDGYPVTYKFYRDNKLLESFQGTGSHSFSDRPIVDGTYIYRVDMAVAGITIRGREYAFVRDTTTPSLSTKPDAPKLVGRTDSAGVVTLSWTPAATGDDVEGFHIYRKDAGTFVEGQHQRLYEGGTFYTWGMNRYLDVSADTRSFADAATATNDAYLGDYVLGRLTSVWWGESDAPHEYYITAYNRYGESAPSNVVTFPYAGGDVPKNGDTAAPGAPTITRAWVEWNDASNDDYFLENGALDDSPDYTIRVAWDEPEDAGATVSSYRATFDDGNGNVHEDSVPRYGLLIDPQTQKGLADYSPMHKVNAGDEDDFNKQFIVTLYAENEAGSTASAPVTVSVESPPRIQVRCDNGTAVVFWDAPVFSSATVTSWELYRHPEHGLVTKMGEFTADVHKYVDADVLEGWTYEYYVIAKTDKGDRQSVTASRLITADTEDGAPGAPTNLTATVVNGRVVLSWKRPAYEGNIRWYTAEFKYPGNDEWVILSDQGSSRYVLGNSEGMTLENVDDLVDKDMQVRVWAENDEAEGERSNVATFKITSEQAAAHVPGAPGAVTVSGEAGDGWCKVTWSTNTAKNKPPATEYRIMRHEPNRDGYQHIGTVAAKGEGSYDYAYVDRTAENGTSYRYMVYPANCGTEALVDANYNYVTLEPTGKLHDQQVAEAVAEIIASLPTPDNVTLDDAEFIREVAEIWKGLSDDQRKFVKAIDKTLPTKLSDDVAAVEEQELLVKYADVVAPVQALIDALPDPSAIALTDKAQVADARTAYDAITPAQAKRPVKTTRLTDAEKRIVELEKEAAEATRVDISAGKATLSPSSFTYDGKAKRPNVKLIIDGTQLKTDFDYKVAYTGNVNAGKATVTLTGMGAYKGALKAMFSIAKAANPLTVKGKTAKVKAKKLAKKKKTLAVSKVIAFKKAGKGTKKFVKISGSKRISINKATGKVTVKKKTKKGTHRIKVAVTASGNANYKAATRIIKLTVKVR